jgi:soluble lytic murein transglycosylase
MFLMKHGTAALILLLVAGLACSLQSTPEPIVVTATPVGGIPTQGAIIITATPEITATPAPIPTSTLPPSEGLAQADLAVRNGDYEKAVSLYQAVLNDALIGDDIRSEAAFSMGQAAVREGLFTSAVDSLSNFIESFPNDPRLGQAYFMRGDAHLGAGNWQSAIGDFQQYLALKPGVIDSYAHERIGDAYLNLGQNGEALNAYQLATESARTLSSQLALREKLAVGYINIGSLDLAIQQYDAILSDARNGVYRANIEYQAGQLEIASGLTEQGYARLQAMMQIYPTTPSAYNAMLDLLNAGIPVDDWLRAQIAYANEDYVDALNALNRYTTQLPVVPVETLLMLGRSYRAVGNFPAAYTTFQTILDQYTTDPSYGLAWLEQGRTLFMEGDTPNAINRYLDLATTNPQLPEAAEALWRAGYLYSEQGNAESALATFDILGTNYPGTEQAQSGLQIAATLAYRNGQTERAQAFYTQLANTGTGEARAQAFLWLGRLYQDEGQTDLAIQSFTGATQADPGGYFSVRAEDILAGREPFAPPNGYRFEFNDAQEIADAEQWLRDVFQIQQDGALYPLSDALRNDPRMIRGEELWELADYEAAKEEFENLREAYANDALATYQLAVHFKDIGLYRSSIFAAAVLIELSGSDDFNAPNYLVRLRYPIYYKDLVIPATEEWNMDPLLIFSLIRQESLYEGFATSFAAAQGLMQIIPATGYEINERIGYDANYQNSDVYRPYINVHFGTFYLSWVKDLVEGQAYAALAGYNGGPGNAMEWLSISGPDIDLFVQTVTFDETKLYVERIYEQYTVYRRIYGVE